MAVTPEQLAVDSACFCGLSDRQLLQAWAYSSAVKAGLSTDPNTLAELSDCFCGLDEKQLLQVIAYATSANL